MKRDARFLCGLCLLLGLSVGVLPLQAQPQEDHRLVSRYEGSVLLDKTVAAFDAYDLVVGRTAAGTFEGKRVEGNVTRLVYKNPPGRSTLEIFRNYQRGLTRAGATMLYTCALTECGPAYASSAWNRYNGLFVASDGDPRYLSATLTSGTSTAYVAVMVGRARSQVDIAEVVGMEENLVQVDAGALAEGIDREGRVSVYGIHFDVDKADLQPESTPALDAIAGLLRQRPALRLFIVGHTDMTGDLQHNRSLSEARARAVVAALVDTYGVAATRLEGYGIGPLAPVSTNGTAEGRAKNRRVELVER